MTLRKQKAFQANFAIRSENLDARDSVQCFPIFEEVFTIDNIHELSIKVVEKFLKSLISNLLNIEEFYMEIVKIRKTFISSAFKMQSIMLFIIFTINFFLIFLHTAIYFFKRFRHMAMCMTSIVAKTTVIGLRFNRIYSKDMDVKCKQKTILPTLTEAYKMFSNPSIFEFPISITLFSFQMWMRFHDMFQSHLALKFWMAIE